MYIIVIGGGRVGHYLTRTLLDEGHEVLLVEKDLSVCETVNEELGSICYRGDGCEAATLEQVGTSRADMMVAVTGDDEDNLVSCQVAKYKFKVPKTIARITSPQNQVLFKKLGVDVAVGATNIILEHIEELVPTHPLTRLLDIEDQGMEIVEIKIHPEATSVGKSLREISLPKGNKLALVIHEKGKFRIPTINTVFKAGDRIIAITTTETEEELRTALRGS